MRRLSLCLVLLATTPVVPVATPAAAAPDGQVRVVDGDTLKVGGVTVRLHGIDAPEQAQACGTVACGRWAAETAAAMLDGRPAACTPTDVDRYDRIVARCTVAGRDVGAALVEAGVAMAFQRYSTEYVDHEKRAFAAGRGIWAWDPMPPWDWRATGGAAPGVAPANCPIKGNVSGNGRIYHIPGQADYGRTKIDPDRGERWFCSEDKAVAAGWRRARR